jgi:hypothetical protein
MWKEIKGFEDRYKISDEGQVYSIVEKIILKPSYSSGYPQVNLYLDGRQPCLVSRLVAEAFLPNPDNLPLVRYKDRDPNNVNASNLYWCSFEEKNQDEFTKEKMHDTWAKKNGIIIAVKGEEKLECRGIREAAAKTGVSKSTVQYALSHTGDTKSGWFFYREKGNLN